MSNKLKIILLIMILYGCDSGSNQSYSPSAAPVSDVLSVGFDIVSFFAKHPIIRALSFLQMIDKAAGLGSAQHDPQNNTVSFDTGKAGVTALVNTTSANNDNIAFQTPTGEVQFSPAQFMQVNSLTEGDTIGLQKLDQQLLNAYRECSDQVVDAITSQGTNLVSMLEMRLDCLKNKGIDENTQNYMRIKHEEVSM